MRQQAAPRRAFTLVHEVLTGPSRGLHGQAMLRAGQEGREGRAAAWRAGVLLRGFGFTSLAPGLRSARTICEGEAWRRMRAARDNAAKTAAVLAR